MRRAAALPPFEYVKFFRKFFTNCGTMRRGAGSPPFFNCFNGNGRKHGDETRPHPCGVGARARPRGGVFVFLCSRFRPFTFFPFPRTVIRIKRYSPVRSSCAPCRARFAVLSGFGLPSFGRGHKNTPQPVSMGSAFLLSRSVCNFTHTLPFFRSSALPSVTLGASFPCLFPIPKRIISQAVFCEELEIIPTRLFRPLHALRLPIF